MAPAALMPSDAPRMTMAVLMNHSGRAASASQLAAPGKKLPITSPTARATMNPASPVSPSDWLMPKVSRLSGVAAM